MFHVPRFIHIFQDAEGINRVEPRSEILVRGNILLAYLFLAGDNRNSFGISPFSKDDTSCSSVLKEIE